MIAVPETLMSAAATILIILTYFYTILLVARMRGKHGVTAPAMSGHPEFDRAFRVHMNTLEQMPMILPFLWLASLYFHGVGWLPAALGVVWIIGRLVYMKGYMVDPNKRGPGFGISMFANLGLLVLAIIGIANA